MATQTPEERKSALLAAMSAERGFLPKEWQYVADHDVDFLEAYNNVWRAASNDGKALPIKIRELIFIAILCHRGAAMLAALLFRTRLWEPNLLQGD